MKREQIENLMENTRPMTVDEIEQAVEQAVDIASNGCTECEQRRLFCQPMVCAECGQPTTLCRPHWLNRRLRAICAEGKV